MARKSNDGLITYRYQKPGPMKQVVFIKFNAAKRSWIWCADVRQFLQAMLSPIIIEFTSHIFPALHLEPNG